MKKLTTIIILGISILSILSCNSETDNDEEIIRDIFPQITDSLNIAHIKFPPPPPPPNDTVKDYPELTEWRKRMENISSQKKLVLLVYDTLRTIEMGDFKIEKIIKNNKFYDLKKIINDTVIKKRKIELAQLNELENYDFQYFNSYQKESLELTNIEDKKFGGILGFSRIYLNKSKDVGILKLSHSFASRLGAGYIITIEKVENKWRIIKVHSDWVT